MELRLAQLIAGMIWPLAACCQSFTVGFTVDAGTHIPLGLVNSVSTKTAAPGDRIYLVTVYPIVSDNRIVIPPGSYVNGTVTRSSRPGKLRGRGELFVRFDSLTLPNGVVREFRSRLGAIDGQQGAELDRRAIDRNEGSVRSDSNVGGDLKSIGQATVTGTSIGAITGAISGRAATSAVARPRLGSGSGATLGAGIGAAAGLVGVLLTRGPDATLAKGTTVEMVLDRPLTYSETDLDFAAAKSR